MGWESGGKAVKEQRDQGGIRLQSQTQRPLVHLLLALNRRQLRMAPLSLSCAHFLPRKRHWPRSLR